MVNSGENRMDSKNEAATYKVLKLPHKGVIYYISKEFIAASFLVQLSHDFGYSGFLHPIWGEKQVPAKSQSYEIPWRTFAVYIQPVIWTYLNLFSVLLAKIHQP